MEAAVRARRCANVRQVEVAVDVEKGAIAVLLRAHVMREVAEPGKVVARIQIDAVGVVEPFPGADFGFEITLASDVHVAPCRSACLRTDG